MSQYITGATETIYGMPIDSPGKNFPGLRPEYFLQKQNDITITYTDFTGTAKSRSGEQYSVRSDIGYLRTITFNLAATNQEMVHWFEWYFRERKDELILPVWPSYLTIVSQVGATITVDTLNEDFSVGDYALLLHSKHGYFSIRQISSFTLPSKIITLASSPTPAFSPGDLIIPMIVGYSMETPKFTYSVMKDTATVEFSLREKGSVREINNWSTI